MRNKFLALVRENIKRDGIEDLIRYIEDETDFFTSPASTKYHLAQEEGLLEHSLNVYDCLRKSEFMYGLYSSETLAIVSLFHDLCKANTYKVSSRNVKNQVTGSWEQKPYFDYDVKYPFGHGEKTVYLLMKFIDLTDEEALAINWHMGSYDYRVKGGSYDLNLVYSQSILALELHIADMRATHIVEK